MEWLHRRLMYLLNNHYSNSLMYSHSCKPRNHAKKPLIAQFSILDNKKTFQPCGNASSSQLEVGFWTCPHPEKRCIISGWLLLSPPSGSSGMYHLNCLLVAMKRHHRNWNWVIQNVCCIIETTAMLIVLNVVSTVGKSLETPTNVIQLLPIWHCTALREVMKGFDFCSLVFHHLLDRWFG